MAAPRPALCRLASSAALVGALAVPFAAAFISVGCASTGPAPAASEEVVGDETVAAGELTSKGPGGIASVTAGMANADPRVIEAEALLAEGRYQRALAVIDEAIAAKPTHARFHYVRGNALSYLDRDGDARAAYRQAIELSPEDALPHAALASSLAFARGASDADRKLAIEELQTALRLDPELASAHRALGAVLLDTGDTQAAIAALETADRLRVDVETIYLLAQAHGEAGSLEEAVGHARRAVELEPGANGADLRLLLARLLLQAGDGPAAAEEFQRVGKLAADSPPLRLEVARGLLELGDPDAAMVHMQWLLEAAPTAIPVIVNHGRVLTAQGEISEALARFDAALAQQPDSQAAQVYRIEALVAGGDCPEARRALTALAGQLDHDLAQGESVPPRAVARGQAFLAACE